MAGGGGGCWNHRVGMIIVAIEPTGFLWNLIITIIIIPQKLEQMIYYMYVVGNLEMLQCFMLQSMLHSFGERENQRCGRCFFPTTTDTYLVLKCRCRFQSGDRYCTYVCYLGCLVLVFARKYHKCMSSRSG